MEKRKVFGTLIGIILWCCCAMFFTYAFYTWKSENTLINANIEENVFIELENDGDVEIEGIGPVLDIKDGVKASFTANNPARILRNIYIDLQITSIDDELLDESFKYMIVKSTVPKSEAPNVDKDELEYDYENPLATGDFDDLGEETITIGEDTLIGNTTTYYDVIFYIDGNMKSSNEMMDKAMKANLIIRDDELDGQYAVFKNVDGLGLEYNTIKINKGDKFGDLPTPEKDGYTFGGWYLESDYKTLVTKDTIVESDNDYVDLYAKWIIDSYKVLYNLNGGSQGPDSENDEFNQNAIIEVNDPEKTIRIVGNANGTGASTFGTKTYYLDFLGWTSDDIAIGHAKYGHSNSAVTNGWDGKLVTSSSSGNIYFKNLSLDKEEVTLNANWKANDVITLDISKEGYTCEWNTKADGSGKSYEAGSQYKPSDDSNGETLYAICSRENVAPIATLTSTATLKEKTQTATLACNDNSDVVSYYWGMSAPDKDSKYTEIVPTKNMSVNKEVDKAGTYYLTCKDSSGNVSTTVNKVYRSYSVDNMLLNITGTASTYSTANYTKDSTDTYIAPSGITLTLSEIYDIPEGASVDMFKGASTGKASSSSATVSKTNPTLSDNTTYSMWFNRNEYTITVSASNGGSNKVENQRGTSVTATNGSNKSLTIRYGEEIKATATSDDGYDFTGWSNLSDKNDNPITMIPNKNGTITANFKDVTKPVATISTTSNLKVTSQTATLTCTDTVGVVGYYWGVSAPSDSTEFTSITSTKNMSVTKTVTAEGTYYLACKDSAGNVSSSISKAYNSYVVNNMLDKLNGTQGNYTANNYEQKSSYTYIAPNGTSITLASVYTAPGTIGEEVNFVGMSIGKSSTTESTVSTTAPTLNANTTYSMWFNRKSYTLTLNKGTGIYSVSGNGSKKWGAEVSIDATVSSGYSWKNWTSSGAELTKTKNYSFIMPAKAVTYTANAEDITAPTCELQSTTNLKAVSQTVTTKNLIEQGSGISKYYWGTSSSGTPSDTTKPTMTADAAGTWYLRVQDKDGNTGSCSIVMRSYVVNNMLDKLDGTQGEYTTSNYEQKSSYTYIAPNGTSIILASVYTAPGTVNTQVSFIGVSIGEAQATNKATVSTTAPTLNANTTYSMWFNRKSYTLTLNKGTGISSVTGAGSKKWGSDVSIDATVTNGYTWVNWTGYSTTTTKNYTFTMPAQAVIYTANASDQTKPVASITTTSILKSTSQTATLACTDAAGVESYYWGNSSTPNADEFKSVTLTTAWSKNETITEVGTYYLVCKDSSGNISVTVSKSYYDYEVNNMLLMIAGVSGNYTLHNYEYASTNTYIAPSGIKVTLSSLGTAPSPEASDSTYKGGSIGTPYLSTSATFQVEDSSLESGEIYTIWFDRITFTITATATAGGSNKVEDQRGNSVTATNGNSKNLTIRYGEMITATATASTGYNFSKWSNLNTSTTNPLTVTPNKSATLNANFTGKVFSITLAKDGGTGGSDGPIYLKYAGGWYSDSSAVTSLTEITPPTKTDYVFQGYYSGSTKIVDSSGKIVGDNIAFSSDGTITAKWKDDKSPTCLISTTSTLKSTSQTATLTGSDNVGIVAYYWGTSAPNSSSTYTSVTSTTSFSATKSITSSGTYYLSCKDAAGNVSTVVNQVYNSYVVNNMLLNVTGIQDTYTTANYEEKSTYTYIAPNGIKVTLFSLGTVPETEASDSTYLGGSIGAASSSTSATFVAEDSSLEDGEIYSIWYSRKTFTIKATAAVGGSNKIQDQRGNSVTATSGSDKTLTIRYGESITATAIASTGYIFSKWSSLNTSSTNPLTITPNKTATLTANFDRNPDLYIYYNVNGGTVTPTTEAGKWAKDSSGFVTLDGSYQFDKVSKGGSTGTDGFYDYNNPEWLEIKRTGYSSTSAATYNTKADGSGTTFGQSTEYTYDYLLEYAKDCGSYYRLDLYVNWVANSYTVVLDPNGGSVSPTSKKVVYNSTYGDLPTPTKNGYTFEGWSLIPSTYQKVDYIESVGGQFIETGVIGTARWEFDIQFTDTTRRQLMGYGGSGSEYWGVAENSGNTGSGKYGLANWSYMGVSVGNRDKVIHNYGENGLYYLNVNNTNLNISVTDVSSKEYKLFDLSANSSYTVKAKLYGLKTIQNGVLVRDFVPCYRKSDGVVGLYDKVNGVFYTNTGSGSFTYGSISYVTSSTIVENSENHTLYANWKIQTYDINYNTNGGTLVSSGYTPIEYIESTGTQYIDTEFSSSNGFKGKFDIEFTNLSGNYVAGSHNLSSPYGRNGVGLNHLLQWELGTGDTCPASEVVVENNTKYSLDFSTVKGNSYLNVDGDRIITTSDSSSRSDFNVFIFYEQYRQNSGGSTTEMKLYSGRIYSSSNLLVRNMIPAKNSSGVIGVYDSVNDKFYSNSGTGTFSAGVSVLSYNILSDTFNLPIPSRLGYTFNGWYTNSNLSGTKVTKVETGSTGDKNLYAKWDNDTYSISYELNGGTNPESGVVTSYNIDTSTFSLPTPEKDGYTFGGWYESSDLTGTVVNSVTKGTVGNKKFYASWVPIDYNITYNTNGGTLLPSGYTPVEYIQSSGPQFIDTGVVWNTNDLRFVGEYSYTEFSGHGSLFGSQCGSGNLILREESGNLTWYSSNSGISLTTVSVGQKINFDLKTTSSGTYNYSVSVNSGTAITGNGSTELVYDGNSIYLFDTNCAGQRGSSVAPTITAKLKLYSFQMYKNDVLIRNYIPCKNSSGAVGLYDSVNSKFYPNDGTGAFSTGVSLSSYNIFSEPFNLPTPTRNGYTFKGWYASSDLTGTAVTNIVKGTTGNKTFYAKWDIDTYNINYDTNGGTLLPSGYIPLEYIESSGTQYIDTGFVPNQNTRVDIVAMPLDVSNVDNGVGFIAYGSGVSAGSQAFECYTWDGSIELNYGNNIGFVAPAVANLKTTIIQDKSSVTITNSNGTYNYTHPQANFTTPYTLYLFALHRASILTSGAFRLYSTQIYDNETLVRNMIPAKNSSGTIGLYDSVNGKFYSNDGTGTFLGGVSLSEYKVTSDTFNLPIPTKKGYEFEGWYEKSDLTGLAVTSVAKGTVGNKTFYAKWEEIPYNVILNSEGASTGGTSSVTAYYGQAMPSITIPTSSGYDFKGYFDSNSAIEMVSSIEKYGGITRVSFLHDANNWLKTSADVGTHVQAIIVVQDSAVTSAPALDFNDIPLNKGTDYTVSGSSGNWTFYVDFDITSEMLSPRTYGYDTGYRFIDIEGGNLSSSTSVTVSLAVKDGKKYYDSNGNNIWNYDVIRDSTLYAKWELSKYTVSYAVYNMITDLGNVGSTVSDRMTYSISNNEVTVKANYDDGYGFIPYRVYLTAGTTYVFYCDVPNATWGTNTEAYLMLNGTTSTYYRMNSNQYYTFTPSATGTYWLRLDVNQNGSTYTFKNINIAEVYSTSVVTYTKPYGTMPVPTKAGYTFEGSWYSDINKTTKYTSTDTYNIIGDQILYGYMTPTTYTISYNANGGSNAPGSQTKYYGVKQYLSSTVPVRNGYNFLGWSTNSSATSATYSAGSVYTTNADLTLYAVWESNIAVGSYIKYTANSYSSWRVLFNNKTNGLEIVSTGSVGTYTLSGHSGYSESIYKLNIYADNWKTGSATSARVFGGRIGDSSCPATINIADKISGKLDGAPNEDTCYSTDVSQAINNGLVQTDTTVWLGSRYISNDYQDVWGVSVWYASWGCVRTLSTSGGTDYHRLQQYTAVGWTNDMSQTFGFRPVITLPAGYNVISGNGTSSSPYELSY